MKHPADFWIKYLLIRYPQESDADIEKRIVDNGFLAPDSKYLPFLRQEISQPPPGFDPTQWSHRPSMAYLRELGIYELFWPSPETEEAFAILQHPDQRLVVEQILLSKMRDPAHLKQGIQRLNKKHNWHLTEQGVRTFQHFFWNVKLMTFDEWGRYLYGRASLYERFMAFLQSPSIELVYFHLRLDQNIESKDMIRRAQQIAYYTLEEVNLKPGTSADKVKAIAVLSKAINECHEAMSTSDMALKDVLRQFERFRMEHPQQPPKDINELARTGSFSGTIPAKDDKGMVN